MKNPGGTRSVRIRSAVLAPAHATPSAAATVLRSKGLKDATCVGWFGDD